MGGQEEEIPHDEEELPEASSWKERFTCASPKWEDGWLVDVTSTYVETEVFIKEGSIESK